MPPPDLPRFGLTAEVDLRYQSTVSDESADGEDVAEWADHPLAEQRS